MELNAAEMNVDKYIFFYLEKKSWHDIVSQIVVVVALIYMMMMMRKKIIFFNRFFILMIYIVLSIYIYVDEIHMLCYVLTLIYTLNEKKVIRGDNIIKF